VSEDQDEKKDHDLTDRISLIISVVLIFIDVLMSVIDFAVFTVRSRNEFTELTDSLSEDEASGGFSALPKCMWFEEIATPQHVLAEDNCMLDPAGEEVDGTLPGWALALLASTAIWCSCLCVRMMCLRGYNPSVTHHRSNGPTAVEWN
jgi:hypothetical protein